MKKRKQKRLIERLKLSYRINNDVDIHRSLPTLENVKVLFNSVYYNRVAVFSLSTLSKYDLSSVYCVTLCDANLNDESLQSSNSLSICLSLLQYAIILGRDSIIAALIRSGTPILSNHKINTNCPCSNHHHNISRTSISDFEQIIARKLKQRSYQNIVWILRVLYHISTSKISFNLHDMIISDVTLIDDPNPPSLTPIENENILNHTNTSINMINSNMLLKFPSCLHACCYICFWSIFCEISIHEDISCPECHTSITDFKLTYHKPKHHNRRDKHQPLPSQSTSVSCTNANANNQSASELSSISQHEASDSGDTFNINITMSDHSHDNISNTSSITKSDSYKLWLQLPSTTTSTSRESMVTNTNNQNNSTHIDTTSSSSSSSPPSSCKPPFQALSLNELANLYIGEVCSYLYISHCIYIYISLCAVM